MLRKTMFAGALVLYVLASHAAGRADDSVPAADRVVITQQTEVYLKAASAGDQQTLRSTLTPNFTLTRANGESLATGEAYVPGTVGFTIVAMSASPNVIVEEITVTNVAASGAVETPVPLIVRGGLVTEIGLDVIPPSPPAAPRRHRLRWEKVAVGWLLARDEMLSF